MQALRVLHVSPVAGDAWGYGGLSRVADALARGLAARGHHVTLCTTDACDATHRLRARPRYGRRHDAPPPPMTGDIDVRVFPNVSNWLAYRQGFVPLGLRRYLERHAATFDVAHLHACRNLPGAIAARCLDTRHIPYVLAPNGTAPNLERRRLAKGVFDGLLGTRVIARASRVMAVTEAERRQLIALGVAAERIAVVPNPVAIDEFEPPLARGRWRQRLNIEGPLVAYLGTLMPRKRVEILIRACAGLPAETTFVVAGNDLGSEAAIRGVAREVGVHDRTRFTGLITGRARLELLADADVVVYPSRHEVFGLVPLEALLAGTPVVVANDSGCGEIVKKSLAVRIHRCDSCGLVLDRDHNAAKNILRVASTLRGGALVVNSPETPCSSDPIGPRGKSREARKPLDERMPTRKASPFRAG